MLSTDFKSLLILICILCVIIGVLVCMNYSHRKDLYKLSTKLERINMFTDMLLNNIASQESIDIQKYIDITSREFENTLKGGE